MPAPASFIDITITPFSRTVTQAEFNVANEIWFRYVAASQIVIGGYTNKGGTYSPKMELYESDGTTLLKTINFSVGWWWLLPIGTYYIKVVNRLGGATDFDFTSQFNVAQVNRASIPDGSYLVPDDNSNKYIATIRQSDGTLWGFQTGIPTGEIGSALPDGKILVHDRFALYTLNALISFSSSLAWVATNVISPAITEMPRICNNGVQFFVLNATTGLVYNVSAAGVLSATIATLPITPSAVSGFGVSRDGTILYWAEYNSAIIQQYVIATAIASTLYTVPGFDIAVDDIAVNPNSNPGDIIVLPDGTLVTWWKDSSLAKDFIIHLSSDGVLLNSIESIHPLRVDHLDYASATLSTSITVWYFLAADDSTGRFGTLNLTTGILSPSFDIALFTDTTSLTPDGTDDEVFGPSNSCPMMVLFTGITPPASGDHIFVMTDRRNDDGEAIPTPFFITSLLGD